MIATVARAEAYFVEAAIDDTAESRPAIEDTGEHPRIGGFEKEFRHRRSKAKKDGRTDGEEDD